MTSAAIAPGEVQEIRPSTRARQAWADNLKVLLVAGVIVGHATMAWTGIGQWVVFEPPVREPLLTVLLALTTIGALIAMPLFFLIAGLFTPRSLDRKGLRRFLVDRSVRLVVPMAFFVIFLAPLIEYVDADNVGWDQGFLAFVPTQWWPWPPAWGPTWFLAVLLLFSTLYAVARAVFPRKHVTAAPLRGWHLAVIAAGVALAAYAIRFQVPLGDERWHLAVSQAPAWIAGFVLGVLGAEHSWFCPLPRAFARRVGRVAWGTAAVLVLTVAVAGALGAQLDAFGGGGTWESLLTAALEGALVVSLPLWVIDVFWRRWDHQGGTGRVLSRAAFAAFILHQAVLLLFVLATRYVPWPPEVEYLAASLLGVAGSFGLAILVVRLPGMSRVV